MSHPSSSDPEPRPIPALFVIDMQKGIATDPATRIPDADRVLANAEKLITAFRENCIDLPRIRKDLYTDESEPPPGVIIIVQHTDLQPGIGPFLQQDTAPWELVFQPRPDELGVTEFVIHKTTRDAFESPGNEDLAEKLKGLGIGRWVYVCGIQSEYCVLSTIKGLLRAGFGGGRDSNIVLVEGAHSTYDGEGKTAVEIEEEVQREVGEMVAAGRTVVKEGKDEDKGCGVGGGEVAGAGTWSDGNRTVFGFDEIIDAWRKRWEYKEWVREV